MWIDAFVERYFSRENTLGASRREMTKYSRGIFSRSQNVRFANDEFSVLAPAKSDEPSGDVERNRKNDARKGAAAARHR